MIANATPVLSTALAGWDSAETLRLLIQVSPAATIVLDHTGQVVLWNPAAARLFGWAPDEVLGQPHPIVPEEKRDEYQALFARVLQGETLTGLEIRRRRRDGHLVDLDASAAPVPDSNGGFRGAMVVFTDQTERKQTERERDRLREQVVANEALLHETGRLARVGGWELDLATLRPRFTEEIYCIHEVTPDFLPTLKEAIHFYAPEARPIIEQAVRQGIADGTPWDLELPFRTATGRPLWVRAIGRAVFRDGKAVKLVGSFQDITERRRAEESLRESELRFRVAFEHAPAGMAVAVNENTLTAATIQQGGGGRNVKVNRALCDFFGCTAEEALTADAVQFVLSRTHPDDLAADVAQFQRVLAGEIDTYHLEKRYLRPSGEVRWGDLSICVARNAAGQIDFVISHVIDITERKRAEDEHRRLEVQMLHVQKLESLGVLAGGIAHDFNNLLTSMLGYTSLALQDLPNDSPARPFLDEVERAASRAADLTQQMLAYSGKGRFVVQKLDLSRLVREMAQLLQTVVSKKAVFQFDCTSSLPPIEADATQLRQVVMNLITNASDALEDQCGLIRMRTGVLHLEQPSLHSPFAGDALPGDYVFLEVTDSGQGMSPEIQARIFDPFFTTKFTGRGLGLAATLGIVRGHRGVIKVVSAPGQGSTFQVLLPRAEMLPVEPAGPARPRDSWHGQGTILVVDDEAGVRAVVGRVLEAAGFRVLAARDGAEGLELFERQRTEVVAMLLDLTMPRKGGLDIFRELRRLQPGLPVFLMSGYSEEEVKTRCAGLEFAGFLEKPFHLDNLVAVIRAGLEGRPSNSP